ncbi:hypothetical protein QA645_07160 [Bradyrhizobium sp. CIAT3101]|nr:hypothetical protein [Bradyrhizobium sp. CIAT3101]WFU82514.1 hypothetical protein QA645_07160 [Bradyrhizobium sp. CIAT3101]
MAFILPLILVITFLCALGIVTGAHLHGRADQALSYVCPEA